MVDQAPPEQTDATSEIPDMTKPGWGKLMMEQMIKTGAPMLRERPFDEVMREAFPSGTIPWLDKEHQGEPPLIDGLSDPRSVADILGGLTILLEQDAELHQLIDKTVETAREYGSTWKQIGEAAGISMQSAHTRWSEKGRATHRELERRRTKRAKGDD